MELTIFVFWLTGSVMAGSIADNKGYSGAMYFFFALVLSPLLGLIYVAAIVPDYDELKRRKVKDKTRKRCNDCREVIMPKATICPYCQSRQLVEIQSK